MQQNTRLPYSEAEIELIEFCAAEIITTSSPDSGSGQSQNNPNGWTGDW